MLGELGLYSLSDLFEPVPAHYRLDRDPWQLTNLLNDGDPTNNPRIGWLQRLLQRYRACSASSCP